MAEFCSQTRGNGGGTRLDEVVREYVAATHCIRQVGMALRLLQPCRIVPLVLRIFEHFAFPVDQSNVRALLITNGRGAERKQILHRVERVSA